MTVGKKVAGLGGIDKEDLNWLAGLEITDSAVVAAILREIAEHAQFDTEQIDGLLHKFVAARLQESREYYLTLFGLFWTDEGTAKQEFTRYALQHLILEAQSPGSEEPDWPWPVAEPVEGSGSGKGPAFFPNERSGLWMCGYRVGAKGMSDKERRQFLDHFFRNSLPTAVSRCYGDAYGMPGSENRLRKMANVLASNCRNFKRNDRIKFRVAIAHWESDLDYLKRSYYRAGMFPWPPTED